MNADTNDWQTPEQKRWHAAYLAQAEAGKRVQCNLFKFWRACPAKGCRRAKTCNGNPYGCFEQFWPLVPEADKTIYRIMLQVVEPGMSVEQAKRAIAAELVRQQDHQDRVARAGARPAAAPPRGGMARARGL